MLSSTNLQHYANYRIDTNRPSSTANCLRKDEVMNLGITDHMSANQIIFKSCQAFKVAKFIYI